MLIMEAQKFPDKLPILWKAVQDICIQVGVLSKAVYFWKKIKGTVHGNLHLKTRCYTKLFLYKHTKIVTHS